MYWTVTYIIKFLVFKTIVVVNNIIPRAIYISSWVIWYFIWNKSVYWIRIKFWNLFFRESGEKYLKYPQNEPN